MWRPSFALRLLDRLMDPETRASYRPNDDEGYQELARRLLACLDTDEQRSARKVRKQPSVTRLVISREMGLQRSPFSFGRNSLRSLILSKNRSYVLSETHDAKGFLNVEGSLLVAHKARKIYNIDIVEPLCHLDMLADTDKILSTLWVELPVNIEEGPSNSSPYWMIILTQNRLLCVDPLRQSLVAEFLLPSEICKFSSVAPNELGRTFCLFGQAHPSNSVGSRGNETDSIVGLFDIYPLKFRGIFRICKEVFGNVTNVSVMSDMVIAFKKKPFEIVLYDLVDFQNNTEEGLYDPEINMNGVILLPTPTLIISEPRMCARIAGNWSTLEYSGLPYHLLGVPWSSKGSYMLVDAARMTSVPSLPFQLKALKNTSLQVEGANILFHSDESGRILRFDGPAIISYSMERSVGGEVSFQETWRTNLWVNDSFFHDRLESHAEVRSSFGRHIKLTADLEQDYRLVIKGVDIDIDCQIIAVITECDLHSPIFDDPSRPFDAIARRNVYLDEVDMCTVIFLLDDATGAIVKIAMMREQLRENTTLHFDMSGVLMCFNQRGHRKSFLEVQRLYETGVLEWEQRRYDQPELCDIKFNSSELSKRQTRLRARNSSFAKVKANSVSNSASASDGQSSTRDSIPRIGASDIRPSTSQEIIPGRRRRKRLRIVYLDDDDDSSDSDYRPSS